MTIQPVPQPISPLRQRMLEDMAMRGLREDTQCDYIRFVRSFAGFLRRPPDTATAEDIRRFQVHQAENGVQPQSINCSVSALRFFFTVTLQCHPREPPFPSGNAGSWQLEITAPLTQPHQNLQIPITSRPCPAGSCLGGFRTPAHPRTGHLRCRHPKTFTMSVPQVGSVVLPKQTN